ncbi:asparagine-rich antigen, putative [Plasmodium knowlesi strain H]|uniref:Asparagine-rich antigen, putative n=3 Tax=Plasmodium knowlesi TaxID=5850 RepID=A0A5K1U6S7_PLAKH|nr:conserved Plasmodium protein, unknown function [Plasmodium knowlesi strain H]OTN66438.1 putative Asparagine-rich antigen [Plasmodium knowlesi]CAA9986344.1 conserved Plasmodium protein, unknown function [Plasmodium knowlesi strain H]SBO25592.1 asparagine-rich antigen, putative [Plasmodium knowlesi strain H]SBO28328.1 asparagine-rich antigen, putative [Plasmodium knowlesi strain H]VVS75818.1 conserved Plasmodium protein, unknown function [Plasmodium knowlesi strain H]|eukprot:XP_002257749.1 Asparagine-rich antigen, putative [Plasmodium knowlesi strain H]
MYPSQEREPLSNCRDKEETTALPYFPRAVNYVKVNKPKYRSSGNYHHKQARECQVSSNGYANQNNYSYMCNNISGYYSPGNIHPQEYTDGKYHKMGYNEGVGDYLPRGRTYRSNNASSSGVGTVICEEEIAHPQYNKTNGGNRYQDYTEPNANGFKRVPMNQQGRSPNGMAESNGMAEKEPHVEGIHRDICSNGKGQNWSHRMKNRTGRIYPPRNVGADCARNTQMSLSQSDERSGTSNGVESQMKGEFETQEENHYVMEINNDKGNPNGFSTKGRRKNNGRYMNPYKGGGNYANSSVNNRSPNYFGGGNWNHGYAQGYAQSNGQNSGYQNNNHHNYNPNYNNNYDGKRTKYNNYRSYNNWNYHGDNQGGRQNANYEPIAVAKVSNGGENPLDECSSISAVQKEGPPDGGVPKSDNCVVPSSPSNQLEASEKTDVEQIIDLPKEGCNEKIDTYDKLPDPEVNTEVCLNGSKDKSLEIDKCAGKKNNYDGNCNSEENRHGNNEPTGCGEPSDIAEHFKQGKDAVMEVFIKDECSSRENPRTNGINDVMESSTPVQANNGVPGKDLNGNYSPVLLNKNCTGRKKAANRSYPPVHNSNYEININGNFWRGQSNLYNGSMGGAPSDDPNEKDPFPGPPPTTTHKGYKHSERVNGSIKSLSNNAPMMNTQGGYVRSVTQLDNTYPLEENNTVTKEYGVSGNGNLQVGNHHGRTLREDGAWEASPVGGDYNQMNETYNQMNETYNQMNETYNQVNGTYNQSGGNHYFNTGSYNPGRVSAPRATQEPTEMYKSGGYKKQSNVYPQSTYKRQGRNLKGGKFQFPSMHECFFSSNKGKWGSTRRDEPVGRVDEEGRNFHQVEGVYSMTNEGTVFVGDSNYTSGSPFCAKNKIVSSNDAVESSNYDTDKVYYGQGKPKYDRKDEFISMTDSTTMNFYREELKTFKEEVEICDRSSTRDKNSILVNPELTEVRSSEHLNLIMPMNGWKKEPILRRHKKGTATEKHKRAIMGRDSGVTRKGRGGLGDLDREEHIPGPSGNYDHDGQHSSKRDDQSGDQSNDKNDEQHGCEQRLPRANAPSTPLKHRRSRSENTYGYQNKDLKNLEVAMIKPHMEKFKRTVNVNGFRTILERVSISYVDGDVVEGVPRMFGTSIGMINEHQRENAQCTFGGETSVCSYVENDKGETEGRIESMHPVKCSPEKEAIDNHIGAVKRNIGKKDRGIYFPGDHLNYGSSLKTQNTFLCLPIESALLMDGEAKTDEDDVGKRDADEVPWEGDKRMSCSPEEEEGSPSEGIVRGEFIRRDCVGDTDVCGGSSPVNVNCGRVGNYGDRGQYGWRDHRGGKGHHGGSGNYGGNYGKRNNYRRGDVHNEVVTRNNPFKFVPQETTPLQSNRTDGQTINLYSKNEIRGNNRYDERGIIENEFTSSRISPTGTGTTTTATITTMDTSASNYAHSKVHVNGSVERMPIHRIGHKGFFSQLPERRRRNVNTSDYFYMSGQNDSSTENYPHGCSVGSSAQSGGQDNSYKDNQAGSQLRGTGENYTSCGNTFGAPEHPRRENTIGGTAPVDNMQDVNGYTFNGGYGQHNQNHMNGFTQRMHHRNGTVSHYGVVGSEWTKEPTKNTGNNTNHFNNYANRKGTIPNSRFSSQRNVTTGNIFSYADGGSILPHHNGNVPYNVNTVKPGSGFDPNGGVMNPGNKGGSSNGGYHYNGDYDTTFKSASHVNGRRKGRNATYVGGYGDNWSPVVGPNTSAHFAASSTSAHRNTRGKGNHVNGEGLNNARAFDELMCEETEVVINNTSEKTSSYAMGGKKWENYGTNNGTNNGTHYRNNRRNGSSRGTIQSKKTQPSEQEEKEHTIHNGRQNIIEREDVDPVREAEQGSHADGARNKSRNRWSRGVEGVPLHRDTRLAKGEKRSDAIIDVLHGNNGGPTEGEPPKEDDSPFCEGLCEEEENGEGNNEERQFKRKNQFHHLQGDPEGSVGQTMRNKKDGLHRGDLLVGSTPCDDIRGVDLGKEEKCVEMVRDNGTEEIPAHFEVAFKGEGKESERKDNAESNHLRTSRVRSNDAKVDHVNSSARQQVVCKMRSPKQGVHKGERRSERTCNDYGPHGNNFGGTNNISRVEPVLCHLEGENADDPNDPTEGVNQFDITAREYDMGVNDQEQIMVGENLHGSVDLYTQETGSIHGRGRREPNGNNNHGSYRRKNKNRKKHVRERRE